MWEQQPHGLINIPDILYLFPLHESEACLVMEKSWLQNCQILFIYIEEGRGEKGKILESPFLKHSTMTQAT